MQIKSWSIWNANYLEIIIKNFTERKYMFWIATCFLIALRRPDMILNAQPWAEDGPIFILQALDYSWQSLSIPYAGYFHLIPRVVSLFAVKISQATGNGITYAPVFMNAAAIVLSAKCINYLCYSRFDWVAPLRWRFLASFLIICMPSAPEVFGTITNVHWWLGYYLFLTSWDLYVKKQMPTGEDMILLTLSTLSSPLGFLWATTCAIAIFNVLWRKRTIQWKLFIIMLITNIGTFIQLLNFSAISNQLFGVMVFLRMFFGGVISHLFFPNYQVLVNHVSFYPFIFIGILLLAFIVDMHSENLDLLTIPLFYMFSISFLSLYRNSAFANVFQIPYHEGGGRYFFIPSAIFITIFCCGVVRISKNKFKLASYLIVLLFLMSFIRFPLPSFTDYRWYQITKTQQSEIPINPEGWKIKLNK